MLRHVLRHLGTGFLAGFAAGSITGLLEVLACMLVDRNSVVSRTFLFEAALIYGLGWSMAQAFFAVISALFTSRRRERWGRPEILAWHSSFAVCLSVLIVGGGYVNLYYLPGAADLRSVLFDTFLLAVCFGLFFLLRRLCRRLFRFCADEGAWRRLLAFTLGGLTLLLISSAILSYIPTHRAQPHPSGKRAEKPCNIILIVMDAVRADHLSLYGYHRETDPNLKRFAKSEGILFQEASAQASWTKPSVATLLTSLYLSSHRAYTVGSILPESVVTVTEILHDYGFRTAFFSANEWISPLFNFDQGVDHFFVNVAPKIDSLIAGHLLELVSRFSQILRGIYLCVTGLDRFLQTGHFVQADNLAPVITQKSLEWIEANRSTPLFAYIHYIDPHAPYSPPSPYDTLFDPNYRGEPVSRPPPFIGIEPFERATPLSPGQLRNTVARYDGEIRFCDDWVGRLFEGLKRLGVFDKSLIIVTSDHGEEFYEHGGWEHGQSLYEELIHIPLIIKLPDQRNRGLVIENLVRHLDIAPTILDWVGVPKDADMDGISLLPLTDGDKDSPLIVASFSELDRGGGRIAHAIRTARDKLVQASLPGNAVTQLFDLEEDPQEKRDIFEQRPGIARELSEELHALHRYAQAKAKKDVRTVKMDASLEQRLKALGYVQ